MRSTGYANRVSWPEQAGRAPVQSTPTSRRLSRVVHQNGAAVAEVAARLGALTLVSAHRDCGLGSEQPLRRGRPARRHQEKRMRLKRSVARLVMWERVCRVATVGTRGAPHLV